MFKERNVRKLIGRNTSVEEFTYLGSTVTHDLDCKREVTMLTAKGQNVLSSLGYNLEKQRTITS